MIIFQKTCKSLLFLLASFSIENVSNGLEITHLQNGEVILSSETCRDLEKHVRDVERWAIARGDHPLPIEFDCEKHPEFTQIDVSSIIPSSVKAFYGKNSACDGANCWNAALIDSRVLPRQRHTCRFEWTTHLEGCVRRIGPAQPGDIAAIRKKIGRGSFEEIHGFTVINESLACSKNGESTYQAYKLQPMKDVFTIYGPIDQKHCINPKNIPPANCGIFVNYYDCSKYADGIKVSFDIDSVDSKISSCATEGQYQLLDEIFRQFNLIKPQMKAYLQYSYTYQIHQIDQHSDHQLTRAIRIGNLQELEKWASIKNVNEAEANADLPLVEAVLHLNQGRIDIVQKLVEKGADVNKKGFEGWTAVNAAANRGELNAVAYLVSKGAKLDIPNHEGALPIHTAASFGKTKVIQFLKENGAPLDSPGPSGTTATYFAIVQGFTETLEYLLKSGANPNHICDEVSLLHTAVKAKSLDSIQLLIQYGADPTQTDPQGYTPLQWAEYLNAQDIVHYFKEKTATSSKSSSNQNLSRTKRKQNEESKEFIPAENFPAKENLPQEAGFSRAEDRSDMGFSDLKSSNESVQTNPVNLGRSQKRSKVKSPQTSKEQAQHSQEY